MKELMGNLTQSVIQKHKLQHFFEHDMSDLKAWL